MQSFLIIGGSEKARQSQAETIIGQKLSSLENNPDFIHLSLGEEISIGIDQVRQMQKAISLKPYLDKQKFCLISEAQNLTSEAQNSLLKILEEPPVDCQIILTVSEESLLLPTILSRCQTIFLNQEKKQLEKTEKKELLNFFSKLLSCSLAKRLILTEEEGIGKNKQTAEEWLEKLIFLLREILLNDQLKKTELPLTTAEILAILRLINRTRNLLSLNANVKLVLENFLLDLPIKNL